MDETYIYSLPIIVANRGDSVTVSLHNTEGTTEEREKEEEQQKKEEEQQRRRRRSNRRRRRSNRRKTFIHNGCTAI